MRSATAALVLGLAASLAACARPGNSPSGTPAARSQVTIMASAAPGPPQVVGPSHFAPVPGTPAVGCDGSRLQRVLPRSPRPPGSASPRPTSGPDADAAERTRRALEAANPPLPRRGPLPPEAAAQAEACARSLSPELNLLMRGVAPLDERTLRRFLTSEGLTGIVIGPGLDFAAATGKACVHGRFTAGGPALSIGPPTPNGTCRP